MMMFSYSAVLVLVLLLPLSIISTYYYDSIEDDKEEILTVLSSSGPQKQKDDDAAAFQVQNDRSSDPEIIATVSTSSDSFHNSENWYDCSKEMGILNPKLYFTSVRSEPNVITKSSGQTIYKTMKLLSNHNGSIKDMVAEEGRTSLSPSSLDDKEDITTSVATTTTMPSDKYELTKIMAQLTQMYHLFDNHWITFLRTPYMNECKEHDGTKKITDDKGNTIYDGPLCPFSLSPFSDDDDDNDSKTPANEKTIFTIHPPLNKHTPYGLYRSKQIYKDGITNEIIGCVDMKFLYCETTNDAIENNTKCMKKKKKSTTTTTITGSSNNSSSSSISSDRIEQQQKRRRGRRLIRTSRSKENK